jgi:putative PIN family toxin of toxin-antitoxin system
MSVFPVLVLDTNTVLALWHFADPALASLTAAISARRFGLSSREDALEELRRVLAYPRLAIVAARQAQIVERYRAQLVPPDGTAPDMFALPQCRDQSDQKFLEIARERRASHLLTRDRLLLELGRHRLLRGRFRIMTPERFLSDEMNGMRG